MLFLIGIGASCVMWNGERMVMMMIGGMMTLVDVNDDYDQHNNHSILQTNNQP